MNIQLSYVSQAKALTLWLLDDWHPYATAGVFFVSVLLINSFTAPSTTFYTPVLLFGFYLAVAAGFLRKRIIVGLLFGALPYYGDVYSSLLLTTLGTGSFPLDYAVLLTERLAPNGIVLGLVLFAVGYGLSFLRRPRSRDQMGAVV